MRSQGKELAIVRVRHLDHDGNHLRVRATITVDGIKHLSVLHMKAGLLWHLRFECDQRRNCR
jgi:hypothetical protein